MRPIPLGQTITLAAAGSGSRLLVENHVLSAAPQGEPLAPGAAAGFCVVDRGLGRVALSVDDKFISVAAPGGPGQVTLRAGEPGEAETFQWIETPYGDLLLLSLATQRYLQAAPGRRAVSADQPGPRPDRTDGVALRWN
jgi:hypothetical protein